MNIVPRQNGDIVILYLKGDIDINSSIFIETVGYHLENGIVDILCDFAEVDLVDYTGLSVLAIAYKNVLNHHGRMKFINVPIHIKNIFSMVCLDTVFEIYDDEAVALGSFKEDRVIAEIKKKQLRRRFKRLPLSIPVKFKLKHVKEAKLQKGKAFNLSAIGAYILCDKAHALGDILALQMSLMPKPGLMELDAKVVWVAKRELMPQLYPGMGVEFYNINSMVQSTLIQYVERNLSSQEAKE
ncbi:MAG: hypothetical protein COV72_07950 [Candidatus Omnitrophica bacterium CG11_big_fil_rev_8_21_14_0_20_42_13]|uniref:STAS domain-containing protein n=1 Tax=Candidatus Ghiorseimicrobium undicola TaxID=1974746 RepID=A0A2H0LVV8_9BACT|nr:MAG: hypothetical protein COV72_07950 [Candidatus Omnitrophica bacterium CG11_big_fil_rev_8_21_14_0_20_42_13]